jgi:hypothetical protein
VWRDAYSPDATWMTADDLGDPIIVRTVGYIIDGPKGYVTVADSTYVTGGERWYGGVTVIPAAMVVERTDRGDDMFLAMARRSAAMVLDHKERALPA